MTALIDIRLQHHPVAYEPPPRLSDLLGGHFGAECVFLGRTREENHPQHGRLVRLSYEAYAPMAERTLHALANVAAHQYGALVVRVHHAVGDVPPGEASVFVQVVTAHRDRAFDCCRMLIDRLKAEAPIWKREVWADGTTWSAGTPVASAAGGPCS